MGVVKLSMVRGVGGRGRSGRVIREKVGKIRMERKKKRIERKCVNE